MKILLTAINSKYIHSNYALRLLKAYAEQELEKSGAFDRVDSRRNLEIEIAEYTINNLQSQILADIYQRQPDCIMFSCYIWNMNFIRELLADIKKILPEVFVSSAVVSFKAVFLNLPFIKLIIYLSNPLTIVANPIESKIVKVMYRLLLLITIIEML